MTSGLIGATGFVGGNLLQQHSFDGLYHSRNITEIDGSSFDLLVCAGARAEKWKINQHPEEDLANIKNLMGHLETVHVRSFVLVSTVDVYPEPRGVDEDTVIDPKAGTPYGQHRKLLEDFCRKRFDCLVVRLPGLFGPGLKKNVLFDLLHQNNVDRISLEGSFQYYPLSRLWTDIACAKKAGLQLVNFATEPIQTGEIVTRCFPSYRSEQFANVSAPLGYDFRTKHAALFGGQNGYVSSKDEVLNDLADFVKQETVLIP